MSSHFVLQTATFSRERKISSVLFPLPHLSTLLQSGLQDAFRAQLSAAGIPDAATILVGQMETQDWTAVENL